MTLRVNTIEFDQFSAWAGAIFPFWSLNRGGPNLPDVLARMAHKTRAYKTQILSIYSVFDFARVKVEGAHYGPQRPAAHACIRLASYHKKRGNPFFISTTLLS